MPPDLGRLLLLRPRMTLKTIPTTQPIASLLDEETIDKLQTLGVHIERLKERERRIHRYRRGEPRFGPNLLNDEEYDKWKRIQIEMSRLYG